MFVSIPRDLWTGKSKINAVLSTGGVDGMKEKISAIIGMSVESYVSVDFDGLRWLIDYFGGVEVEVENTFTDSQFPNINDSGILAVSFNKGKEIMDGDRALTYARSRKGDNGEGSDLKRAKRQHQILKGVLGSISKPQNLNPFNPQEFYKEVITNSNTDITLEGALYMYSFYNLQEEYQIESLILDERYIYHPTDASPYGGAWVFVSKDPNFENLKNDIMTFFERS
jgi:LCP family protein required for cell wall assembly